MSRANRANRTTGPSTPAHEIRGADQAQRRPQIIELERLVDDCNRVAPDQATASAWIRLPPLVIVWLNDLTST